MALKINNITVVDDSRNANLVAITATGNVNATNIAATGTLQVTGDTTVVGNLVVQGSTITTNINDFLVSDPLLQLGRGANNSPLVVNDGLDRGIQMYYFDNTEKTSYLGFDNDFKELQLATDVSVINNTVTINGWGSTKVGNLVTVGNLSTTEIVKTGTSGVGNIGSSTNTFNTVHAKATSAQYADLAEMYESDVNVEPGTVVHFGGEKEVTICNEDMCKRVAGVISTNPSYLMNSAHTGEIVVAVALTGRVPCKVIGPVKKGDMMVSASNGYARAESLPVIGSVIGKALEDFDGESGVIEVVVGRL